QGGSIDQALFFSGEIEYALGNAKRAIQFYEQLTDAKALLNSSWRPDAQYALGVAFEQLKQDDRARAVYEKFLKENPDHRLLGKVTLRLADVLLRSDGAAEAEKLLRQVADSASDPLADYAMLRLGQALAEQDKFDQAAQVFEAVAAKFPKSEHVRTAKLSAGQMYFRSGRYAEAAELFRSVMEKHDAQGAEAAHLLSMTLQRTPQADQAVAMLEETLKWADKTPSALQLRMDLADALYNLPERIEDARQMYEKIASEFPKDPLAPRALYNAAFAALQTGKLDQARQAAERFLKEYPQDPLRTDVAYVASETMLQQGQHAAAIEAYKKLIESDPTNAAQPIWNMRLAMAYYLGGKYQEALQLLESKQALFATPPQKAEAEFIMGSCYLFLDKPAEAIAKLQASHRSASDWNRADEVLLLLAQAYGRQNDAAAALKTLSDLLAKYPQSRLRFQARYRMGQLHATQQNFDAAIADYKAILAEPTASGLHDYAQYGVAISLMKQEKYQEALEALGPLLSKERPASGLGAEALLAKAVCLRKLDKTDEAIEILNDFLAAKPVGTSLAGGLYELGMAYVEQEQFDQAIATFERLLKEVPDYAAKDKILYELAWALWDKSEPEKSAARFQELIDTYPESEFVPEAIYQLAQQQYDAKQYAKAAPMYTSVLAKAGDAALKEKALYKLGWSLFQQAKYPEAAEQFKKQAEDFPSGSLIIDSHFMAAECLFKQDKFAEALAAYQNARELLEQNPNNQASEQVRTLIYLHGAQCLREQKKWAEAEKWLREIVSRYPSSPYLSTVIFELATAKQNLNQPEEALRLFGEVASKYRDEIAARARFMMGELYFAQRQFDKAIPEFQRVMFGYGAEKAEPEVKNWQARGGFEAGRCSEVLIQDLTGQSREKAIQIARDFYQYVIDKHPTHEVVKQAQVRLNELNKLR
ncbi:MAG: tetratricopeptide repeat protein, partial [Aureliella sp.]